MILTRSKAARNIGVCFPLNATIYIDGVVYDFYSAAELGQQEPGPQWLTFPLPREINNVKAWMPAQSSKAFPIRQSLKTKSGLSYVDKIYVISDPSLNDRIENIKRMFIRHSIPVESIHWRLGRWNRTTCTAKENQEEVYRTLNLQDGPLGYTSHYLSS